VVVEPRSVWFRVSALARWDRRTMKTCRCGPNCCKDETWRIDGSFWRRGIAAGTTTAWRTQQLIEALIGIPLPGFEASL
jgi:hypothetical protein